MKYEHIAKEEQRQYWAKRQALCYEKKEKSKKRTRQPSRKKENGAPPTTAAAAMRMQCFPTKTQNFHAENPFQPLKLPSPTPQEQRPSPPDSQPRTTHRPDPAKREPFSRPPAWQSRPRRSDRKYTAPRRGGPSSHRDEARQRVPACERRMRVWSWN